MNRAYGANVGMTDKAEHVLILSLAAFSDCVALFDIFTLSMSRQR